MKILQKIFISSILLAIILITSLVSSVKTIVNDLPIERVKIILEKPSENVIAIEVPIIELELEKGRFLKEPEVIIPIGRLRYEDGVYIDLEKMELELWINGEMTLYPVLAIRKGYKNFNTPTGDFEALYKNENHLSSLFDVWMPYSIQFSGNYFLHGYPTYNDDERTLVPYGNSGGCIRMDTDDMREIFNSIEIGTPIIVI